MLKRKDKILISAIELLDAEGVKGVTTKNLAKLQKVTEPALYRQYSGKQDILNHIIEEYGVYDNNIINTINENDLRGKEAIIFYVKRYAELYYNYAELTTVMYSMDLYQYNETTKKRMQEIVNNRVAFLCRVIESSEDVLNCDNSYSSEELASMINGTIYAQVYEWRMNDKDFDLEERLIRLITKLICNNMDKEARK